jgi:NADH-quinone oxidoreductase subunit L
LLITLLGRRLGHRSAGAVLSFGLALTFGAALAIAQAFAAGKTSLDAELGPWLPLRGADFALRVGPSTVPLLVALTAVALLIALAAVPALADDDGASRFAAAFGLSTGALLLVIAASDLLLLFAGWELLAVGTYLLVAHRRDRPADASAAMRSFVVARIGDTALLLAIIWWLAMFRTVDIAEILQRPVGATVPDDAVGMAFSLLVIVAALARSAQLPFQVWLPDTTRAPAAASALLQSSLAAGGVVLLLRLAPFLHPGALESAAAIGAITAVVAAVVALAQDRRSSMLAWSTISQLGLMFVAAGTGAAFAAVFLLITHAAAKAALTLGADARGSRIAAVAVASGTVALAAVPPAAGFFSVAALAQSLADRPVLLALVLGTVLVTGLYAARLPVLADGGSGDGAPATLLLAPLVALAVIALGLGGLVASGAVSLGTAALDAAPSLIAFACAALAVGGLVAGLALRTRNGRVPAALVDAVRSGFELDALYRLSLVVSFRGAARLVDAGTEHLLERAGDAVGRLVLRAGELVNAAHRRYARASEAIVIAATAALLAYWTLR